MGKKDLAPFTHEPETVEIDPDQEVLEGMPREDIDAALAAAVGAGPLDEEAGSEEVGVQCEDAAGGDSASEPSPGCEGGEIPTTSEHRPEPGMKEAEVELPEFRIVPKMLLSHQEQGIMVRSRIKALEEQTFETEVNMWEAQVAGDGSEVVALRSDVVRLVRVTEALALVYNQKYGE